MSLVQAWINECDSKEQLSRYLTQTCYETGKNVVDGGKGCACLTHRAFRAGEVEANNEINKPLIEKLISSSKDTNQKLADSQKEWGIKDDALKAANQKVADQVIALGDQARSMKDLSREAADWKQEANKLQGKVDELLKELDELTTLKDKIKDALSILS